MKIGIDIDDTLTNTKELQHFYWKEYYNENPTSEFTENIPENINRFGNDYIDEFWNKYRFKLFNPSFKDNASNIIKRLREENNIIYIITSRPNDKYPDLVNKLKTMFDENNIEYDFICTSIKNKAEFLVTNDIDILIDDDILHIEESIKNGKEAILFNDIEFDGYKTNNWIDIYGIIKKIKEDRYEKVLKKI